jgi:hypothetical protein
MGRFVSVIVDGIPSPILILYIFMALSFSPGMYLAYKT